MEVNDVLATVFPFSGLRTPFGAPDGAYYYPVFSVVFMKMMGHRRNRGAIKVFKTGFLFCSR